MPILILLTIYIQVSEYRAFRQITAVIQRQYKKCPHPLALYPLIGTDGTWQRTRRRGGAPRRSNVTVIRRKSRYSW